MDCTGVKCAQNATCFSLGSNSHVCRCNDGFVGDGIKKCEIEPFKEFTVTLVLIIALFCILVALLLLITYKKRLDKNKKKNKKSDPYSINWYAYIKEWKNTTVRLKEKARKPLDQNGGHYVDPSLEKEEGTKEDNENDVKLPSFKIDDETVRQQKSKLQQSNSIRINITPDDDENVGEEIQDPNAEKTRLGIDNPAYALQQQENVESKYDNHEEISLSSFKPTQEVGLHPDAKPPPERPPPYSSKHSFKEDRRSPRMKPRIKTTSDEADDVDNQ